MSDEWQEIDLPQILEIDLPQIFYTGIHVGISSTRGAEMRGETEQRKLERREEVDCEASCFCLHGTKIYL